ncbi:hypothetical protein Tco_0944894, partial [Tanacetum coccineum]
MKPGWKYNKDMQQMLKQAKILKDSFLNGLSALKSNFTRKHKQGITKSEFERAFSHIFGEDVDTFTRMFSQNMDTLEQQLTKETILESNCQNAFRVLKTQFEKIFTFVLIKPLSFDGTYARKDFHTYTGIEPKLFKEKKLISLKIICSKQSFIHKRFRKCSMTKSCRFKSAQFKKLKHRMLFQKTKHKNVACWVNERLMRTTEEKIDTSKTLDASLVDTESSGTESKEQDTSSRSRNNAYADDANIIPIYDEEPMTE